MEKLTGKDLTEAVINCKSWKELKDLIEVQAPFISYDREIPVEWTNGALSVNIEAVRTGYSVKEIPTVNGLRAKVAELMLMKIGE